MANRTDGQASAICPVARRNGTQGWAAIAVFVRDRHSTQDITCIAQARDLTGASGSGWQETKSAHERRGGTDARLRCAARRRRIRRTGLYAIVCSIPTMEEAGVPSYIASYIVVEP